MKMRIMQPVLAWLLAAAGVRADTGAYRNLGYLYLSPLPGAEYTPAQTKFVLVRFKDVSPTVVTNLSQFIQVSGAGSGIHTGQTKIASDKRTVIFEMTAGFQSNELVTVNLTPLLSLGTVQPYQYQFMISGHLPDPPAITARGDNPPDGTKGMAFDRDPNTQWLDGVVPDGSELWLSTNDDPSNKSRIAYVTTWTNSREWNKYTQQKSASISLVAGRKYYIEALQKEHDGGDNLAVGWARPGQATSAPSEVIPGWVLSPWSVVGGASPAPAPDVTATTKDAPPSAPSPDAPVDMPIVLGGPPLANYPVASPGKTGIMPNGVSVPSSFPHISITTNNNPCPDPIFIDNRSGWHSGGLCYNVIFDNSGSPIWYQRMPDERRDMKVQPNGMLTMLARDKGLYYYGLNTHYEKVAEYWSANGYSVDEHELQMLADGTYFLIGLNWQAVDLSRFVAGAGTSVGVTENCIQQFTPQGELIFQWRAWDHLDPAGQAYVVSASNPGDFPHMNAIAVDSDGHILLSSRNTSEVTKINADSGEIIWRLGGTHNQFSYVNDPLNGQRNQHAVRPLGSNRYTLFDNGNGHSPQVSRAVEYELNPNTHPMTATVVWQYPATPTTSLFAYYMGNCQRLSNGNTLINWVISGYPKLTEVCPDGSKAFEMHWVNGDEAYRVWRCPWQGVALKPYLIVEPYSDNVTLLFNQFGDTDIATYHIYGGTSSQPTTLLASSAVTMKQLSNLTNGQRYYFRVAAVNHSGVEGTLSNEESVLVNFIKPGQNMVSNGDFSDGSAVWTWALTSPAIATWSTSSGYSRFNITNAGSAVSNVQLRQAGMQLVQGKKYIFEFDAWADTARSIEAKVGQEVSPYTNYSGIGYTALTTTKTHYRYAFTMTAANDLNSRVVINTGKLGTSTASVNIDNVSLFTPAPGDLNEDGKVDLLDLKTMTGVWPKQQSGLSSDLDGDGRVDFKDLGILGDNWSASP